MAKIKKERVRAFLDEYFQILEDRGQGLNGMQRAALIAAFTDDEIEGVVQDLIEMFENIRFTDRQRWENEQFHDKLKDIMGPGGAPIIGEPKVISVSGDTPIEFDPSKYSSSSGNVGKSEPNTSGGPFKIHTTGEIDGE